MNPFGERMRKARQDMEMTQADLAEKLGITHTAVVRFERGDKMPGMLTAVAIAQLLGQSLDYLVGLTEKEG